MIFQTDERIQINEHVSFVDHQTNMVRLAKQIARTAQDMVRHWLSSLFTTCFFFTGCCCWWCWCGGGGDVCVCFLCVCVYACVCVCMCVCAWVFVHAHFIVSAAFDWQCLVFTCVDWQVDEQCGTAGCTGQSDDQRLQPAGQRFLRGISGHQQLRRKNHNSHFVLQLSCS